MTLPKNVKTGIPGLDELVGGGFPEGRVILIVGGPGAGKTLLASQFLYNGIQEHNENGVFISLDETKSHYYEEMLNFGWDFAAAEEDGQFAFIDATRMSRVALLKAKLYKDEANSLRGNQLSIDKLVEEMQAKIQQVGAKRVALDTLASLFYRFPDPIERRTATVDLIESLSDIGITTLITTELRQFGLERSVLDEEYLVHGVVMMQALFSGGSTTRALQVEKMRGTRVNNNVVPYTIDQYGIEIYPNMALFK
jgi:KaiC/GvpD/RAD55 family RecA-like ATPase